MDHLEDEEEGEGRGEDDEEDGGRGEEPGEHAGRLLAQLLLLHQLRQQPRLLLLGLLRAHGEYLEASCNKLTDSKGILIL